MNIQKQRTVAYLKTRTSCEEGRGTRGVSAVANLKIFFLESCISIEIWSQFIISLKLQFLTIFEVCQFQNPLMASQN